MEHWNMLPRQAVNFLILEAIHHSFGQCPTQPALSGLDWEFPGVAANLNHCVILWFYKKALLVDTLWLTLVPCLWLQIWDLPVITTKKHRSTSPQAFLLNKSSLQHPPLTQTQKEPSCLQAELHLWFWDQCWRLTQLEQLLSTTTPRVGQWAEGSLSQA